MNIQLVIPVSFKNFNLINRIITPIITQPSSIEDKSTTELEIEGHDNFFVFRVGVGSEFEVGDHWDFSPEIIYELKNGYINTLTFAIGLGKRF